MTLPTCFAWVCFEIKIREYAKKKNRFKQNYNEQIELQSIDEVKYEKKNSRQKQVRDTKYFGDQIYI